jgi:hypothetical protein
MTQTMLDISLSLDGFATAANVRPEEPMSDGATAPALAKETCGASGR